MRPNSDESLRTILHYILAQLGDSGSIAALKEAGQTDRLPELKEIVFALSSALRV